MDLTFPPGSTTAIGSLPHTEVAEAVDFVLGCGVDIPFWPQLPKRDVREWMVPQYAADLPGLVIDAPRKRFHVEKGDDFVEALTALYERLIDGSAEFALPREFAAGYHELVGRLASRAERPAWVKGQVTGPLTFVLGLNLADGRPIYVDEELRQASVQLIARIAAWQARSLRRVAGHGVVIFVDEPIYSALGTAAYLSVKSADVQSTVNEVARAVHGEGASVGLHCCGNADWEAVLATEIDVLSFDAWEYASRLAVYTVALSTFLGRGGTLAWGIVPTNDEISSADAAATMARLDAAAADFASRGISESQIRAQSVITPSCGCGSRTLEETEKVFTILRAAGQHWKRTL